MIYLRQTAGSFRIDAYVISIAVVTLGALAFVFALNATHDKKRDPKQLAGQENKARMHNKVVVVDQEGHLNNAELGRHGRNRTNVWDYPFTRMACPAR